MHWYLYVLLIVKMLVLYFFLKKRWNPSPENEKKFALIDKLFMILSVFFISCTTKDDIKNNNKEE